MSRLDLGGSDGGLVAFLNPCHVGWHALDRRLPRRSRRGGRRGRFGTGEPGEGRRLCFGVAHRQGFFGGLGAWGGGVGVAFGLIRKALHVGTSGVFGLGWEGESLEGVGQVWPQGWLMGGRRT